MSYTSSSSYNSKHNSKHDCIFALFWDEKLIKEILPRLSLLTRRRPLTSHLSLQVRPGPLAGLRPGLPHCRAGRGLGLPHGHRLLGQEVRLHVGRGQERHEGDGGSPGQTNIWGKKFFVNFSISENCGSDVQQWDPDFSLQPQRNVRAEGYGGEFSAPIWSSSKHGDNQPFWLGLWYLKIISHSLCHFVGTVTKIRIWRGDIWTPFIVRWQNTGLHLTPLLPVLNIPLFDI